MALAEAGRLVEVPAGATMYRDGDSSDSFFVVVRGAIELRAVRRGDEAASLLRKVRGGDAFGEEALLPGLPRRAAAIRNPYSMRCTPKRTSSSPKRATLV